MSAFAMGLPRWSRTIPSTSPTSGQRMFVHICPTGQSGSGVAERITYGGASLKTVNSPRRSRRFGEGGSRVSLGYVYVCSTSSVSGVTVCHHQGVCKERMFVHIYVTGQSRTGHPIGRISSSSGPEGRTEIGVSSLDTSFGGPVCAKRGRIGRVASGSGPEERITFVRYLSSNSGVTDTSFGVPSSGTFFVGVVNGAVLVAVCGVLAKLWEDAKDSDAINTQPSLDYSRFYW